MSGRGRHLAAYHARQRDQALTELRPALTEAKRLRGEGLTWEEVAADLRGRGFTSRSGAPFTTAALYLAARKYPV
ncbi:hypothetical protein DEDE109153_02285 [Deinococcus deserti]|uniref:Recombinase domain-containing protein n=1 Tax=Deinococcus deserti (strain DSM 17065 / CIP 109153 / LMG 22923 / VCD115) TaxID=546414 RepID=C1CV00_DEIDV|nr:hypothetical protein [Deinococcus deserti]ACO46017.2 Hypothetical protein Deide_11171 [Deinococcus deserti VCD115]